MAPEHQSQDPVPGDEIDYPVEPDESHNSDDAGDAKVSDGSDDAATTDTSVAGGRLGRDLHHRTNGAADRLGYGDDLADTALWLPRERVRGGGKLADRCHTGSICRSIRWCGAVSVRRSPRPESGRSCPSEGLVHVLLAGPGSRRPDGQLGGRLHVDHLQPTLLALTALLRSLRKPCERTPL